MLTKWILIAVLLTVPLALATSPAGAGPRKDKGGHGKYDLRDGNCRKGKCNAGARHSGGPPPWAPAHGYRAQRRGGAQIAYLPPFDLDLGRCNRALLGSVLGAAVGGLVGSNIGDGRGQVAAVAGGTLLGFMVGGSIGRSMDRVDRNCIGQALEHAGDGQEIAWNNVVTGTQYQVVPSRTVQRSDGRYCREYTATAVINGRSQNTYGTACRQPDGSWKLVD